MNKANNIIFNKNFKNKNFKNYSYFFKINKNFRKTLNRNYFFSSPVKKLKFYLIF